MKLKLTLAAVNGASAQPLRYTIWDVQLPGFGVRVNADGTKTYVLKYLKGARQRWFTIGRHGAPWTVELARKEAIRLLGRLHEGIDPAGLKAAERSSAIRVKELCADYLAAVDEGLLISRRGQPKKASTMVSDRGRIARHIIPLLGTKLVGEVTRRDIEAFRDAVAAGKTAAERKTGGRGRSIVRGGKGAATRTLGLLGGIFSYGVSLGIRADNPVHGVRRFKDQTKERFLSQEEIQRLAKTCSQALEAGRLFEAHHADWEMRGRVGPAPVCSEEAENPYAIAAIKFLLLTGMRKSEALTLRWAWIDHERKTVRLPDSKTGQRTIPIGGAAIGLLGEIRRQEENPFVFCGQRPGSHFVGLGKVWERVRARANLPEVRLHDLRHTFASHGAAAGISLYVLGKIIGHSDTKMTARYAHISDNPLISGADVISATLAELLVA